MSVNAHLIKHRFPFSIPLDRSCGVVRHRMMFGPRKYCMLLVLICLSLAWPLVALSQEIDEGEFSRKMLGYKLLLLKNQFEQTEMRLLTGSVAAARAKKLEHVYNEIKCLEAEFRFERYYPDLFDEQIVIIREELRLILGDPAKPTSMPERGVL